MPRLTKVSVMFVAATAALIVLGGCATRMKTAGKSARSAGKVIWNNTGTTKIAIHAVDTFDVTCPPQNPGGTFNFRLEAGDSHELTLVDDQVFCWTWRNDSDPSTEQVNFCTAVAGDVISVDASTAPASGCKERITQ